MHPITRLCIGLSFLLGSASANDPITDLGVISRFWGQLSPYADNAENFFGVSYVGLPNGCQVVSSLSIKSLGEKFWGRPANRNKESAHLLLRHAQRSQTGADDDGVIDKNFAVKLTNFTGSNKAATFTGPLTFLNTYQYQLVDNGLLTGIGATTEFLAGATFWNTYGRVLYNASVAQLAYNATMANGTSRPKPVLRTTGQSRIENSQINWALGFFGPGFQITPNPTLANFTSLFDVVIIPEGGTENNTLASYDSCFNDNDAIIGSLGDLDLFTYIPKYLGPATARLQQYAPSGFKFTTNDTYAMQSICAYETAYIGISEFCVLFTADEWAGFENTLDMEYYYDYAYGNPTGRAQGIGYLQELLARLQGQYITSSNSSVNSTLDNNAAQFPLGRPFYADFTHDDIIISALTAMSMDYFRDPPSLTDFPPNPNRHFILSNLTPFAGRLVTEVIGCSTANPTPVAAHRVNYTPQQYGYSSANASSKFIRMRLNNGILPLNTIRGGACGNATSGRVDGMCAMGSFIQSQANSYAMSNYNYACFGNYTIAHPTNGMDYDGTISKS